MEYTLKNFFQGLLVILNITTLISGNSTITTMFQDIRVFSVAAGSWAFADNLCQKNSYRLLTMKNKSKQDALRQYVSKNGISTSTGFWLGMTQEQSGSSNWFWSDATQVQNESLLWKTGYPKSTVGQCVQINTFDGFLGILASYGWQSKACSDTDPLIVCEKDMSSLCFYSDHNVPNVCPKSSFLLLKELVSYTTLSLAECQQKCSIFKNIDYECWSLTFEPSSGRCIVYCYYSPFLLSEILPEYGLLGFAQTCSNTSFQHKTCFSAVVDNTTLIATTSTLITSETLTTLTATTSTPITSETLTTLIATTSTPIISETLTTTTQSTTNFPTLANIPTTLATVTTTAEPTTKFTTSATVEVPTMTSSPTGEMTSGSSITTQMFTSDSSATEVVSLSTTNKPTTSGVTNSRPKPLYLYPCPVTRCLKNSSNETLEQSIQRLTQELTVSPTTTSAAIRKKTCAQDTRSSAAAVGVVGIIILSVIGLLVVIPDVMSFVIYLKSCLSRIE